MTQNDVTTGGTPRILDTPTDTPQNPSTQRGGGGGEVTRPHPTGDWVAPVWWSAEEGLQDRRERPTDCVRGVSTGVEGEVTGLPHVRSLGATTCVSGVLIGDPEDHGKIPDSSGKSKKS